MAHRGPKSQRPGRKKVEETDDEECYLADGQDPQVQGIAHAIHDVVASAAEKFDVPPEGQVLAAAMALAMTAKRLRAVDESVLDAVRICLAGVHYNPAGFQGGSA